MAKFYANSEEKYLKGVDIFFDGDVESGTPGTFYIEDENENAVLLSGKEVYELHRKGLAIFHGLIDLDDAGANDIVFNPIYAGITDDSVMFVFLVHDSEGTLNSRTLTSALELPEE